ncbi:unnamed protein product [Hymenolepis diminuta]|uniref:Peptidase S54 rhomboid domain-containing protein n=1 Tax=Hymenolepis diminuta TaxID=6216 RepID=A0A564YXN4_HYMDI|nr:unnamed protein product [Hymenolepis diminuta]
MSRSRVADTWDGSEGAYLKLHNCRPPPIFIPLIILAETVVFMCYTVAASKDNNPYNDVTAFSGNPNSSSLTYYPEKRHEVWRFVTYILIHKGYFHLIVNVLGQVSLGCLLEAAHKYWRVGIVFLGGAIGSVFAVAVTTPYVSLNGASGGVYALTGAQSAVVLMTERQLPPRDRAFHLVGVYETDVHRRKFSDVYSQVHW